MDLSTLATAAIHSARDRLLGASRRLIADPGDVDAVLDLKRSEQQTRVAVKVIKADDELESSLLDILA